MNKISITPQDLEIINQIVKENDIKYKFDLVLTSGSGIGYTLDLEFETELNGRDVTIKVPVCGVENW